MQPRWNVHWLTDYDDAAFLGGTNSVDIWIDDEGDLRLVIDEGTDGWDYWGFDRDGEVVRRSEDSTLTDEEIAQAFLYLGLFVPDWKERMKDAGERYATQVL